LEVHVRYPLIALIDIRDNAPRNVPRAKRETSQSV
jgi:hypothetical protein